MSPKIIKYVILKWGDTANVSDARVKVEGYYVF